MSRRKVLKHAIRENMSTRNQNKKKIKKNHEFAQEEVFSKRNILIYNRYRLKLWT